VPKPNSAPWPKIVALLILLVCAAVGARHLSRDQLNEWIDRARNVGWTGQVAFIIAYGLWCGFGLPGSIVSLGVAAAFGFWRGLAFVYLGANLGGSIGFFLSRYFARDWFASVVGKRLPLAQFNRAVAASGWRIVMLTRMPPISPFSFVNYAYGLTPIAYRDYAIGTAIGIIPGTTAYVYLGTLIGDVAQATARERSSFEWGLYISGFIVTVGVCIYIVRLAKAALDRHAIEK
jgi:uncharacterized membrane protein YdjX (TVP38/TMEM64 family)